LFLGLFHRGQIATLGKNTCALPKLGLEKAGSLLEYLLDIWGDASGPDRRGVSGGYGDDDRDRTFLGERHIDFSPYCLAVTRPPEMAALSFVKLYVRFHTYAQRLGSIPPLGDQPLPMTLANMR
jgi:hypothetical protein